MALVARDDANASLDASTGMFAAQITGLFAGEDLDPAAPCWIDDDDGRVYMSNGTAAGEAAGFVGFTPRAAQAGQPVTLFSVGARFHYSAAGLTPGQKLYIAATAGRLDDAPTTGGQFAVARAIDPSDIQCIRADEGELAQP